MRSSTNPKSCPPGGPSTRTAIAVTEHEAAALLNMSVHFLRKDRRTKRRIPFYRIGDCIRYDMARVRQALAEFEEGGEIGHGCTRGGRAS